MGLPDRLRRSLKPDYFFFNFKAWQLAAKGRFGPYDLCHHVSPISLRYPDLLSRLPVPFIWGAVGGSLGYPKGFESVARREPWYYRLRGLDQWRLKVDPMIVSTMRRASAIVVTSSAALRLIPVAYREKCRVIGEGVDVAGLVGTVKKKGATTDSDYIFTSGRLVPSKGTEFVLRALARTATTRLVVTGDGPEREHLIAMSAALGLGDRVRFLGAVPKQQNLELMAGSQFCVFPSLKEAFGHVNVEAMTLGKPVIAVRYGGPADVVLDRVTGILIEPTTPDALVANLADAIDHLSRSTSLCIQMGRAGHERVTRCYDWPVIGRAYQDLYMEILERRTSSAVLPAAPSGDK